MSTPGLAPGDQIDVRLFDFPEVSGSPMHRTVSSTGMIHLPYIGSVRVEGLGADAVEHLIEDTFRSRGIVKDPSVSVEIVTAVNMTVEVIGQVRSPQSIPLFGPAPISYVVNKAGGPNGLATKYLTIIHPNDQPPTSVEYDPDALSPASMRTLVYPGDIVNFSSQGVYFMVGEVNRPGIFPMGGALSVGQSSPVSGMGVVGHMTLLQAITDSGGITNIAARSKTRILRTVNGKREEIIVDIVKLEKGEIADPLLQANDIIYVPSSYIRSQTNNLFSTAITSLYAYTQVKSF